MESHVPALSGGRRRTRHRSWSLVTLALLLGVALPARPDHTSVRETQIRAVLVFSIAKYVKWPREEAGSAEQPLAFCILGEGSFREVLAKKLEGRTLRKQAIQVQKLESSKDAAGCALLYLIDSHSTEFDKALEPLQHAAVLTVSTRSDFLDRGGMVRLLHRKGKIRFEVNLDAVEQAGLEMDARLLKLALRVQRGEGGDGD